MQIPSQILEYLEGKANLDNFIQKLLQAKSDTEKLSIANEIIAYENAIGNLKADILSLINEQNNTSVD